MSESDSQGKETPAGAFGDEAGIGEHVACVGCGYDLVGRSEAGRCPECDVEVMKSVDHHRGTPTAGDPEWARKVVWGCWLVGIGFLLRMPCCYGGGPSGATPAENYLCAMLPFGLISCAGWVLVTSVRPGMEVSRNLSFSRISARWSLVLAELMYSLWAFEGGLPSGWAERLLCTIPISAGAAALLLHRYWPRVIGGTFDRRRREWGVCLWVFLASVAALLWVLIDVAVHGSLWVPQRGVVNTMGPPVWDVFPLIGGEIFSIAAYFCAVLIVGRSCYLVAWVKRVKA